MYCDKKCIWNNKGTCIEPHVKQGKPPKCPNLVKGETVKYQGKEQ